MSIRRRLAVVFIGVNAVAVLAVLAYLLLQYADIRARLDEQRVQLQDRTALLLVRRMIREGLENEAREALKRDDVQSLVIDISELSFWDVDPLVVEHLDRAALVRYTESEGTMMFPPRPDLRFDEEGRDGISEAEIRDMVVETRGIEVRRDRAGRLIALASLALDVDSGKNWGVCFRLKNPPPIEFDPGSTLRIVGSILLGATVLLLTFTYFFFRRAVLDPLAELEAAALRTSEGDYDRPVGFADNGDEFGRVARAMNEMMAQLRSYRDRMEGLVDDATDRFKRAEKHLVVAQRLAAMGQLAAGVAHEVNNPLGGVLNALQKLGRDDLDPEKRRRFFEIAEDGVQRIGVIVRRLLDTAPKHAQVGELSLLEAVERARDLALPRLEKARATLALEVPSELRVLGDRHELVQVFINLIVNAADAVEPGGRVSVRAREEAGAIEVEVEDDGRGMGEEEVARAFDLFFTTKPGTEGTGLGLAIVHNIVTGHGGTISVRSREGEGTVFRLSLPVPGTQSRAEKERR